MSDLIERQHAIDEIRFYITEPNISDDETKIEGYNDGLEMAISILSILSSAEPERETGTWEVQPSTGEDRPFIWWKCSECGHVIFSETERDRREFHAFCGRCGADMRGENGKA